MGTDPTNRNAAIHERPVLKLVEDEPRRTWPAVNGRLRMTWLGAPPPSTAICPPGISLDVDALRWLQHNVFKTDKQRSVLVSEASCCGCSGRIYLISGRGDDFRAEVQA